MENRMNQKAVAPVIATILLVVITVVLAAVLYVLVGGIGGGGLEAQEIAGVLVGDTQDGLNWQITFITLPGDLSVDGVFLVLYGVDGTIALEKTPLTDLKCPPGQCGFKIRFNSITADTDTISVGDNITIDKARHPIGARFMLVTDAGSLAWGTFA